MTHVLAVISEIRRTAAALKAAGDEAMDRGNYLHEKMSELEGHWQGKSQVNFYIHYGHDAVHLKRLGLIFSDTGILLDKVADEIIFFDEHLLADSDPVSPDDPNLPWKIDPKTGTVHSPKDPWKHDGTDHVNPDGSGTTVTPPDDNGNSGHHGQGVGGGHDGEGNNPPGNPAGGAPQGQGQHVGNNDQGGGTHHDDDNANYYGAAAIIGGAAAAAGAAAYGAGSDSDEESSTDTDAVEGSETGPAEQSDKPGAEGEKFWGKFRGLSSDTKAGWGCVAYVLSSTFVPWTMVGHWNAGNAKEWVRNAQRWNQLHPEYGITVDHTPRPGAVAVFPDWGGTFGHVAKVTKANGKNFSFLQGNTFFGTQETPQGHYFNNKGELDVPYLLNGQVETAGHNEVWFIHFPWSEG